MKKRIDAVRDSFVFLPYDKNVIVLYYIMKDRKIIT